MTSFWATELEGPKIFNMATGGKRLARPRNDRFESGNLTQSRIECVLLNREACTQLHILYHTQFKRIYRELVPWGLKIREAVFGV